jgi:hypothetical protein
MHQNQFAAGLIAILAIGMLRVHQHLHIWLSLIGCGFHRPSPFALRPRPKIRRKRGEVRVSEERSEGLQMTIVL